MAPRVFVFQFISSTKAREAEGVAPAAVAEFTDGIHAANAHSETYSRASDRISTNLKTAARVARRALRSVKVIWSVKALGGSGVRVVYRV